MSDYILQMNNINKEFPGAKALDNVNLKVKYGQIHALVGENGAGKSTLMNVLSGYLPYGSYTGQIIYKDKECKFKSLKDSEKEGIVIIHQELALIPELSIGENIYLNNEIKGKFGIDWNLTFAKASEHMKKVGLNEDPRTLIKDIGTGKQQLVEIAKALSKKVDLLILDEPTSSLNEQDSKMLLDLLISLKNQGVTSIIISHKLNEIVYCADELTVIRDGSTIETISNENHDIDENHIIKAMVGRELTDRYPSRNHIISDEISLEINNWNVYHPIYSEKKIVDNVSLIAHKGEIVGIYGLQGAGRSELALSVFGKMYGCNISGQIKINGKEIHLHNARQAIDAGLAYVSEDRKETGLVLNDSIARNITLADLARISDRHGVINQAKENNVAHAYVDDFYIKTHSIKQNVINMSGGNQQKVLLAKWIFTQPDILITDEPTRGIDVLSKYEIYKIMNTLVENNKTIIMISSELPELLGMADRIYIMNEGKIITEMKAKDATQENIMKAILLNK